MQDQFDDNRKQVWLEFSLMNIHKNLESELKGT